MCRYAMGGPYKRHFACFACCKAFKQPTIKDYQVSRGRGYVYQQLSILWANKKALLLREEELGHRLSDLEAEYRTAIRKCPECGGEMIDMGLDFKPPKQSDSKAWKTIQGMYRVGHTFHTCGCSGPGWIPKSTSDYRSYLESTKKHYQDHLEQVQRSSTLLPEAKREAAEFWTSRIKAIDREQTNVK